MRRVIDDEAVEARGREEEEGVEDEHAEGGAIEGGIDAHGVQRGTSYTRDLSREVSYASLWR